MLSFFRRIINSKVGIVVTLSLLAVIAVLFGIGDITGLGHSAGGFSGATVATVGKTDITDSELRIRTQNELDGARQQQAGVTMAQFLAGGGLEGTLDRIISTLALDKFAHDQGMEISRKLVDGQIASIPGLQGPDGKFSQTTYDRLLAQKKITDAQVHLDSSRDIIAQHLLVPQLGAAQVPAGMALPYASMLLEKRTGQIAMIPFQALGTGAPPAAAELDTFYKRNIARYTVPERRIVRYALISPDFVKAASTPGDAEIAKAYKDQAARFAATEKRTMTQVVLGDQASAAALAAKVKAGTSIADAAKASGLEPAVIAPANKDAYAAQTSAELANAAYGAAKGAVVGPIKAALGSTVVKIDNIEQIPAKSLDQARPELIKELTTQKTSVALGKIHDALDDAINGHATFDELVKDQKLDGKVTPALLANGVNPDDPVPPHR